MRLYYLDSLRSVLVLLGIFYHVSLIYIPIPAPEDIWMVHSGIENPFFETFGKWVHNFRMPAFYILSGFLMEYVIQRQGELFSSWSLIRKRFVQLIVPCLFVGIVINPYIYSHSNYGQISDLYEASFWLGGRWVMHTWFLVNLFVYCCLYLLIRPLFVRFLEKLRRVPLEAWMFLVPVGILFTKRLGWMVPLSPYGGTFWFFFDFERIMDYVLYFYLGAMLAFYSQSLSRLLNTYGMYAVALVFTLVVFAEVSEETTGWKGILYEYCYNFSPMCVTVLLLKLFKAFFDTPKGFGFLNRGTYSIYLLHMPVIALIAHPILDLALPAWGSFLLISVVTLLICSVLHYGVVEKIPELQFLLNGKFISPKPLMAPVPALSSSSSISHHAISDSIPSDSIPSDSIPSDSIPLASSSVVSSTNNPSGSKNQSFKPVIVESKMVKSKAHRSTTTTVDLKNVEKASTSSKHPPVTKISKKQRQKVYRELMKQQSLDQLLHKKRKKKVG